MSKGTKFTDDFKIQIVALYKGGKPVRKLSKKYGVAVATVYKRIKEYSPIHEDDKDKVFTLKDLEARDKRIKGLELENEILKKATAIFVRKP